MKYHIIYKTTNLLTSRFYIGMHSTNNLNDKYLGSGLILKKSIKKYGRDFHKFEILAMAFDRTKLIQLEEEFVNKVLLKDQFCMNLRIGGCGGKIPNYYNHSKETKDKISKSRLGQSMSQQTKEKISKSVLKKGITPPGFNGKSHSPETKLKQSNKHKGKILSLETKEKISVSKRKITNPSRKIWKLKSPDGNQIIEISGLKPWCDSQGLTRAKLIYDTKHNKENQWTIIDSYKA